MIQIHREKFTNTYMEVLTDMVTKSPSIRFDLPFTVYRWVNCKWLLDIPV